MYICSTNPTIMKTHGARIAYLRKQAQLSQEELAQQLGLVRTTLAVMETNKRKITIEELQKFAAYFQLSLDELVDEQFPNTLPSPVPKKKSATIRMHIPAPSLSKWSRWCCMYCSNVLGNPMWARRPCTNSSIFPISIITSSMKNTSVVPLTKNCNMGRYPKSSRHC